MYKKMNIHQKINLRSYLPFNVDRKHTRALSPYAVNEHIRVHGTVNKNIVLAIKMPCRSQR